MKARMRFWNGKWWCRRMGVTGCGATMEEAWDDMWNLYREAVRPKRDAGCDDAGWFADSYRKQAAEHELMAAAIEQLLPPNA